MTTKLDYAEKSGIENLKERTQNGDLIRREANTLLALLLSGGGAALYFAAKQGPLSTVALAVSIWLFFVALVLTLKCLMFANYPAVWNEPRNLNHQSYELDAIRAFELENLQQRIEQATALNYTKSDWLNICIIAGCATPVIAFIAWLVLAHVFSALAQAEEWGLVLRQFASRILTIS